MSAQLNVQTMREAGSDAELQLQAIIIRRFALNESAIAKIRRLQDVLSLDFSEATIRLGYATKAEIHEAMTPMLDSPQLPAPHIRQAAPAARLVTAHHPFHARSEQIRTLRTELLLRHEITGGADILAVLSPCAGEGRSQLAAELAISFSQLGKPTLLVDADLRNPLQHVLFDADNTQGLAPALAREQKPQFQSVAGLPMLSLLTAGPLPPNPLELLSDRAFEAMVDEWQRNFQFVVLDTPPVGRYADGLAVATIIGRVLSLSRAGYTPYQGTRDMLRRLAATQSRILGAVINHF